jgi:hypothetical protein
MVLSHCYHGRSEAEIPYIPCVTIVKFPEAYIYIGKMDDVASEDFLNLPSEWSPSRPCVRPWSRAQVLAGVYGEDNCRRQLVKNVVLSVPRTYNVHDSNANRDYLGFSYELDNGPEVIDLTVDSASDDDA